VGVRYGVEGRLGSSGNPIVFLALQGGFTLPVSGQQRAKYTSVLSPAPQPFKTSSAGANRPKVTPKRRFSSKSRFGRPARGFVPKTPAMPLGVTFGPCGLPRS